MIWLQLLLVFGAVFASSWAHAVVVHEQLGRNVDLSQIFRNHEQAEIALGQTLRPPQPLLLLPVRFSCVPHCQTQLKGVLDALKRIRFVPGRHFQITLMSLDPAETALQAADLMRVIQRLYGRRYVASGWNVLTGSPDVINLVATNLGLSVDLTQTPGHTSTAVFLDSNGKIVRYLDGPRYTPTAIKAGLIEAGQDQMGSMYERFIYSLSRYDAEENRYKIQPFKTLAWITLPLFVLWLTVFTIRDFLSPRR